MAKGVFEALLVALHFSAPNQKLKLLQRSIGYFKEVFHAMVEAHFSPMGLDFENVID